MKRSAARLVYTECAFRTMYGPAFWVDDAESADDFAERVTVIVGRLIGT